MPLQQLAFEAGIVLVLLQGIEIFIHQNKVKMYNNSDNTETSSISSNSASAADLGNRNRIQSMGLGGMNYFPAEVEGGDDKNSAGMNSPTPEQANLYTLEPRNNNLYPGSNQGSKQGSKQGSNKTPTSDLTMNESDIVSDAGVRPPIAHIRERSPYETHGNHYYGHSGSSGGSGSGSGSMPPPPYGYPYGYAPVPPAHCNPPPPNTYQRYTFIIVSCLAVTSLLQMTRGGLSSYSGPPQAPWNGKGNGSGGGYVAYSPYYYNKGNGQMNMRQNGNNNNNNMIGGSGKGNGNGNGGPMNDGNDQEAQDNLDSNGSETEAIEGSIVDAGMEKYPLLDLENFKDNWDEWDPADVPMFFHIPKAGGSSVKDIIGTCHRFVMASETGIQDGHDKDKKIEVVYPGGIGPKGQDRSPFVNVDTTTVEGIDRAQKMGFADSGLADAVVTYFLYEANQLFTPTAKGRVFTVFRHPIDRAISLFNYIQMADWEPTYDPELKDMTIEEWAQSPKIENNWLTRALSNQPEGELTDDDLNLAMEVIRRKFMVGLMTEIEATMERFERFFRWTFHVNPPNQDTCRDTILEGGSNKSTSNNHKPQPGSRAWELLTWQNQYDLQLYEYIESLFVEQEQFVADIPAGYRNIDATCCKCDPPTYPPEGFTCPLAILF